MPKLRVRVGPSTREQDLATIIPNTNKAFPVKSERFEGQVVVHIKGLPDEKGRQRENAYFETRADVTWSIQVQGRFLKSCSADDVLFGNTFDRPLKLPMGSSFALKFMKLIDPTLDHDLASQKPWALSPLVSTMPHLMFTSTAAPPFFSPTNEFNSSSSGASYSSSRSSISSGQSGSVSQQSRHSASSSVSDSGSGRTREFPPAPEKGELILDERSLGDITLKARGTSGIGGKKGGKKDAAGERRRFFRDRENRRKVVLGPEDTITTDFCYNFITFPDLRLCLPGGLSFDLARYWDGQPVRFVCCRRPSEKEDEEDVMDGTSEKDMDPEDVFWCVSIERMED